MEKLCIDVRGFSDEKKKRVQDAFFELGYTWSDKVSHYRHLDAVIYTTVDGHGGQSSSLMFGGKYTENQKPFLVTYTDLMRKAGLDESDPDVVENEPPKKAGSLTLEVETDLQSIISDYMYLLDVIKDLYARGVIKSQITDLTDLQYKQLSGERND